MPDDSVAGDSLPDSQYLHEDSHVLGNGLNYEIIQSVLGCHLSLDEAIQQQLQTVINDTDSAGMTLVESVGRLNQDAVKVVEYIGQSTAQAGTMEKEFAESVDAIEQISRFVEEMPETMAQDASLISIASNEIGELGSLVELIKNISRNINMVAINASIEAHHAGKYGRSFKVVADEVRRLADHTEKVTSQIDQGLKQAQNSVQSGLDKFSSHSSQQMTDARKVVNSIRVLKENYEDMRQYYKTLFSVVNQHNAALANDLSEMLGQIQYQDVVRQRIERISLAVTRRNEVLQSFVDGVMLNNIEVQAMPQQMQAVLDEYLQTEQRHAPVKSDGDEADALVKFELF
jgi:methyl-accepting chemotaxis protein